MIDIDKDAAEFGQHFKQGGWRLGLLVARSVKSSTGSGARSDLEHVPGKVTTSEFAKKSGIGDRSIRFYYKAWELAADDGMVHHAKDLSPGDEDASLDYDEIDFDNRALWSKYLNKAREPKNPKLKPSASNDALKKKGGEPSPSVRDDVDLAKYVKKLQRANSVFDKIDKQIDELLQTSAEPKHILSRPRSHLLQL